MTVIALPAAAAPRAALDLVRLVREVPDTALAARFGGEAMVQSYRVPLPGGGSGRCWLPTAAALRAPAFGRAWVAGQLEGRIAALGWDAVRAELTAPGGLRLDAG